MDDESQWPIVIDAGSSMIRAGIAGQEDPTCIFPSLIGTLRFPKCGKTYGFVGNNPLQHMHELLSLRYPIDRGIVNNWDDMEILMSHCYKELKLDPTERPVLFAETPLNPKSEPEKFAEMMFETFESPSISVMPSSYLCLMCSGRNCGVMVSIGDGVSFAVPFYESFCIPHAAHRQDFAGRDITRCLQQSLFKNGYSFTTTSEFESIRDIKETLSYTALDFDAEMVKEQENVTKESYKLSDGTNLYLKEEKFMCMEALFQPSKFGFNEFLSIQEMIYRSLESCDRYTKADIMCNIIVSGATALNTGFKIRLKKEMESLLPKTKRFNVICVPESKYFVWIGGSVLGSLCAFQSDLISKQKYEEFGPSIMTTSPTRACQLMM